MPQTTHNQHNKQHQQHLQQLRNCKIPTENAKISKTMNKRGINDLRCIEITYLLN
jgi:hypothetical protein